MPVVADESAIVASDVPPLSGCVSGVNVKLAKCGGVRGALAVIHTARFGDDRDAQVHGRDLAGDLRRLTSQAS